MAFQAIFFLLSALLASCSATYFGSATSTVSRQQNDNGLYNFNYGINDGLGGGSGRWEAGDGVGGVVGYYTLKGPDGRNRRVEYFADKLGFRARVNTNEQGTANSFPAAVAIESPYSGPVSSGPPSGASGAVGSFSSTINHHYVPSSAYGGSSSAGNGGITPGAPGYPAGFYGGIVPAPPASGFVSAVSQKYH